MEDTFFKVQNDTAFQGLIEIKYISRQLGFHLGGTSTSKSHFGSVPSTFAMVNVTCNSTDKTIQDCSYDDETTEDCGPDQGAGVICHTNNGEQ